MNTQTARKTFEVRPFNDNFAVVRTTGRVGHVAMVVTEDDAARIAQALNAHDDLVAALRSAVAVLERSEAEARSKNLPHGVGDAIVYLTSALAKAGVL
jgi:hypothetical protein